MEIIVIGGGMAGLTTAVLLQRAGCGVTLIEKNQYPFHRVCGEYVSNEVIPFLQKNDLWPADVGPAAISKFHLSDTEGNDFTMPLDLGGFGISRYAFDQFMLQKARNAGVSILDNTRVESIEFTNDKFRVETRSETMHAAVVIGAYGKRSHLDKHLNRSFMNRRSPYLGVKYHVRNAPGDIDTVALHNFKGGYCGLNAVENDTFNLCYLSHRDNLRKYKDVRKMEEKILYANPLLKKIFTESEHLWENPLVINEISFETKDPVVSHVLMCGDAAGMITPLCGNGIAMAIHSAKLLSDTILNNLSNASFDRQKLEQEYTKAWRRKFAFRLSSGRKIQRLFGRPFFSNLAVHVGSISRPVARYLMSKTHGEPFK